MHIKELKIRRKIIKDIRGRKKINSITKGFIKKETEKVKECTGYIKRK